MSIGVDQQRVPCIIDFIVYWRGANRSPMTPDPTASGIAGLSKTPSINPFPQSNSRFTQYPQTGGSSSGFPLMTRVEVRNPDPQTQQQKQDELARQQQQQLQQFQIQTNRNLRQIQNQSQQIHNQTIQQLNDVDRAQRENGRLLGYVADVADRFTGGRGQNRPPPPNLDNVDGNTLIRSTPPPPDRTDRFGIVTENNPMLLMRATEGISETPIPEYPNVYPSNDT